MDAILLPLSEHHVQLRLLQELNLGPNQLQPRPMLRSVGINGLRLLDLPTSNPSRNITSKMLSRRKTNLRAPKNLIRTNNKVLQSQLDVQI
jgi:hypothetical protein